MPRAIWTGSFAFGLVNVPVRLYSAIDEHDLELHLVHVKDGSRIAYRKICRTEDRPVPDDEVAKGFEQDGKVVLLTDEDFAAARDEPTRRIEIDDFVPYGQIDPIYFERSYYLGPQEGSEKVYRLLVAAMERAGLAAVVRLFFRDREQLACVRVRDGVLVLEKMYFEDEIRPVDDLRPDRRGALDSDELDLALGLIERFAGDFDPSRYEDTYRDRLLEIVDRKSRGETIEAPAAEEGREPPDLLAALRESVEQAKRRRQNGRGAGGSEKTCIREQRSDLAELTLTELTKRAAELDIGGRSKMTKRELVGAIIEAER